AYHINGLGSQNVALAAATAGAALVYISTNEVFDGARQAPYFEFDATNPLNAYPRSKLAVDGYASHLLTRFFIFPTAWLSAAGGRNFVHRILQLAEAGKPLRVVTDEVAIPTFVEDLADAVLKLIATEHYGLYHLTNAGYCSRHEFASKILELSG